MTGVRRDKNLPLIIIIYNNFIIHHNIFKKLLFFLISKFMLEFSEIFSNYSHFLIAFTFLLLSLCPEARQRLDKDVLCNFEKRQRNIIFVTAARACRFKLVGKFERVGREQIGLDIIQATARKSALVRLAHYILWVQERDRLESGGGIEMANTQHLWRRTLGSATWGKSLSSFAALIATCSPRLALRCVDDVYMPCVPCCQTKFD